MRYDLDLYSNFTYYLEDPREGDQIEQKDRGRRIFGGEYVYSRFSGAHVLTTGVEGRLDLMDVALSRTEGRRLRSTIRDDNIAQSTVSAWAEVRSEWGDRVRTVVGLRGDRYGFDVESDRPDNSGRTSAAILSPKASLVLVPRQGTEIYVSGGLGFHSNDARGTVQSVDPVTGGAVGRVDPLARSKGAEVGLRASPAEDLRVTLTTWIVDLESELLFVGDAGTTEPSEASRRIGLTWSSFWRPRPEIRADLDLSVARARFHQLAAGEDRIPGALEKVMTAGAAWEPLDDGPYVAVRFRWFKNYPLVEDNSVRATATSLVNVNAGWKFGSLRAGASLLNVFGSETSDIAYFYASRLPGEPAGGVEDVHSHPVEPRQLRISLSWGH